HQRGTAFAAANLTIPAACEGTRRHRQRRQKQLGIRVSAARSAAAPATVTNGAAAVHDNTDVARYVRHVTQNKHAFLVIRNAAGPGAVDARPGSSACARAPAARTPAAVGLSSRLDAAVTPAAPPTAAAPTVVAPAASGTAPATAARAAATPVLPCVRASTG